MRETQFAYKAYPFQGWASEHHFPTSKHESVGNEGPGIDAIVGQRLDHHPPRKIALPDGKVPTEHRMELDSWVAHKGGEYFFSPSIEAIMGYLTGPSDLNLSPRAELAADVVLTGWCLAYNRDNDLIFLNTNGYDAGYFLQHSAPGGEHFAPNGLSVKSRESNSKFMVMSGLHGSAAKSSRAEMVEYARRWSGYEVKGEEKKYYMDLIEAALD